MKTILCYGDSNTYGYNPADGLRYPREIRWPGHLQDVLGSAFAVVEEGCNGRTTVADDPVEGWKNGLDYLRPCLNSHKPVDVVIMMLGTNDLKEIFNKSAQEIAHDAGTLVEVIQAFTELKQGFIPKIVLVSPPRIGEDMPNSPFSRSFSPRSLKESYGFSKYFREVAQAKNCIFFDAADVVEPSAEDSLHLTADGHIALSEALADLVREIV